VGALRLDHVSLAVSRPLLAELDFRVTETAGGAGHARVLLDRCYLEVPASSASHSRADHGWFLRPDDLDVAVEQLRSAGINASDPVEYVGYDGRWLDVEPADEFNRSGLPTLTRRLDLDEAAWPPSLLTAHPNDVTGVAELHVYSRVPESLRRALVVLGAARQDADTYMLSDGTAIVVDNSDRAGGGISKLLFSRPGMPLGLELDPWPPNAPRTHGNYRF
jgi:hypothetical protein